MRLKMLLLLLCISILPACSAKQDVQALSGASGTEIAIIEDKKVREGVLPAYTSALREKGYTVAVLPEGSAIPKTGLATTYYALWSWDLGIYLSYLKLEVYKDGVHAGKAIYDSRNMGLNFNKYVNGEEKIREFVNLLFPRIAEAVPAPVPEENTPKARY